MDMMASCSLAPTQIRSLTPAQCSPQAQSERGNTEMLCSALRLTVATLSLLLHM